MDYVFIFIFGLFAGSFLNCAIYRLEVGQSPLKGRSYCPKCKKEIAWFDLLPVASFFLLKGKCRNCSSKISWQYPLVELAAAATCLLTFYYSAGVGSLAGAVETAYALSISLIFLLIFVYDLKHFIIPDGAVLLAAILSLAWLLFAFLGDIYILGEIAGYFLSGIGASAFFLFFFLISRGKWMGFGDIKLALVIGLFLGFPGTITALFLAFLAGAIFGIIMIILGRKSIKSEVPFAPFLVAGSLAALFWGEILLTHYFLFFKI